jgi:hypothetical protein
MDFNIFILPYLSNNNEYKDKRHHLGALGEYMVLCNNHSHHIRALGECMDINLRLGGMDNLQCNKMTFRQLLKAINLIFS